MASNFKNQYLPFPDCAKDMRDSDSDKALKFLLPISLSRSDRGLYFSGLFLIIFIFSFQSLASDNKLYPQDILISVEKNYPEILVAKENIIYSEASIKEAKGEFDAFLSHNYYNRTEGFYDGTSNESLIVKPMPMFNSEIYGGFRHSDGIFPIYEDKLITNSGGEYLVGIKASLLRNRAIDKDRGKVIEEELKRNISQHQLEKVKLEIKFNAMKHYYDWVQKGWKMKIMKDIYQNNLKQIEALKIRFNKGEISEIALIEGKQLLIRRKIDLQNFAADFQIASGKLSIFYRSEDVMIVPDISSVPSESEILNSTPINSFQMDRILAKNPKIQILKEQIKIQQNNIQLGKNSLNPQADLKLEFSNDEGNGSFAREEEEVVVKLDFSIPLQTNKGKSSVRKAESKIKQLKHRLRLSEDGVEVEISNIFKNIENLKEVYELTKEQINIELAIYNGEKEKFKSGNSDLFMINQRENSLAQAKISAVKIKFMINMAYNDLRYLSLDI
ncbi:MAG: outer membrane protein TolC [Rickettsiales bacterium]|jgi:outer membrane protein TolC